MKSDEKEVMKMVKDSGSGFCRGAFRPCGKVRNPRTGRYIKRDATTWQFIDGNVDKRYFMVLDESS